MGNTGLEGARVYIDLHQNTTRVVFGRRIQLASICVTQQSALMGFMYPCCSQTANVSQQLHAQALARSPLFPYDKGTFRTPSLSPRSLYARIWTICRMLLVHPLHVANLCCSNLVVLFCFSDHLLKHTFFLHSLGVDRLVSCINPRPTYSWSGEGVKCANMSV